MTYLWKTAIKQMATSVEERVVNAFLVRPLRLGIRTLSECEADTFYNLTEVAPYHLLIDNDRLRIPRPKDGNIARDRRVDVDQCLDTIRFASDDKWRLHCW